MRQDKLTTKFQEALSDAQSLALGNDNGYIEPAHLLLAMLRQDDGPRALLEKAGVNVPGLTQATEAAVKKLASVEGQDQIQVGPELAKLLQATEKVLGEMEETELVRRVVHSAMRVMRNQKQVTLRVMPELVEPVRRQLTQIMEGYPGVSFVEVAADPRLRRGGCILESELGIVDATVDVQLDALRHALRSAFQRD